MNTLRSWVQVSDYDIPVSGGQAVCLYLAEGRANLSVTSTIPYEPQSKNTEACKSKILSLDLHSNEERTFEIEPAINRDGYACGWRIKPITSHKQANSTRQ